LNEETLFIASGGFSHLNKVRRESFSAAAVQAATLQIFPHRLFAHPQKNHPPNK
jgi:hypothetical protein